MSDNIIKIRAFIFESFLFDAKEEDLDNGASFLEQGVIDSTGVLELVEWLEDTFGISIDDDELIPDNLDSVDLINTFIQKKTA